MRFIQGFGAALINVSTQSIISHDFQNLIGPAFGIYESFGIALSFATGPTIGGFLFTFFGFTGTFYIYGGVILLQIFFIVYVWGLSERYKGSQTHGAGGTASVSKSLLTIWNLEVVVATCVVFMTYFSFGTFEPLMEGVFKMTLGLSPAEVG